MRNETWRGVLALLALAAAACSDALEQDTTAGQVVAVSDFDHRVVSLVSASDIGLFTTVPTPGRSPASVAGRGSVVLVPFGDGLGVIDLARRTDSLSTVVGLATGTGATVVTFQSDSIAWTANPASGTVTRVNYRTGDTASVALAGEPRDVAMAERRLFVVTANPTTYASWLSVVDPSSLAQIDSVPLTGLNAKRLTVGGDGLLYVVSGGPLALGTTEGRLAVVDPVSRAEVVVINGLGDSPRAAVYHPSGRVLVASQDGILEVNALTRSLTRGPLAAVTPGGADPDGVLALAVDQRGRVYALDGRNCASAVPGFVWALSAPPEYRPLRTIDVANCPGAAALALIP